MLNERASRLSCGFALLGTVALALFSSSCASSTTPEQLMGNTNWLASCSADEDCVGAGLSCECGLCTRQCTLAADCDGLSGAVCDPRSEALMAACGATPDESLCFPPADGEADEGGPPDGGPTDGHAVAEGPCGASGASIASNLSPDSDCTIQPEGSAVLAVGLYDIARGGAQGSSQCEVPYVLNLLVNNCADTILQLHSASVTLKTIDGQTIALDQIDPPLPNPFLVTTSNSLFPSDTGEPATGVAAVETIPIPYAPRLSAFVGGQIIAEVTVFGTTTDDIDYATPPFAYPIEICDGCLQVCESELGPTMTRQDVIGDSCPDNSGTDARLCLDPDC